MNLMIFIFSIFESPDYYYYLFLVFYFQELDISQRHRSA